ncbi:hypothetical protein [Sphingobacterium sp. UME9]|uniref:hypothetical protein n=1 Tax=Sphingobacterium sp. UME9 TaxID=1862316 RepID=UPI0015FF1B5D|nr:hypothetical protein [Sphingobacterium sp. UME9]MBB1643633.1 hypothetical protein [Sphingobacterium sp. UME9]
MDLNKIISANEPKFDKWDAQFDDFIEAQFEAHNLDNEENERRFFQTNELLMDIANNFLIYGKFKDKWDTSKCYMNFFGQNLILKSEKMDMTFLWGIDRECFYLDSSIPYAENLRFMTDDFWSMVLELKKYGEFEFDGVGRVDVKKRPYLENKTSTVFQMIRKYTINQIEKLNADNPQQPSYMEMGSFKVKWDLKTDWETLLKESCSAFKMLYSINYQLWKITDLANKKKRART